MSKKNKKQKRKKEERQLVIINNIEAPPQPAADLRTMNLYGDISETTASDIVGSLLFLENTSKVASLEDPEDPDSASIISRDINLYVSTHGGSASDMFSILDVMELIKKRTCDISTHGIGKVMSAGVPILAAGTPGKRFVGKNCRIMLHSVTAGSVGTIFNMENELEEIRWIQERYIECLSGYTKLTKSKIKKILKTQRDVYISSEEAIKLGIADEIL